MHSIEDAIPSADDTHLFGGLAWTFADCAIPAADFTFRRGGKSQRLAEVALLRIDATLPLADDASPAVDSEGPLGEAT